MQIISTIDHNYDLFTEELHHPKINKKNWVE